MSVLNSADVTKIVRMLPREVRKVLLEGECVLAGGFIRDAIAGNEINDIDLFPIYPASQSQSPPLAERIANEIARPYEAEPSQHAFNIKGLGYPVQVIRIGRPESAQQVLDSFDFSVCRAAIWHVSGGIGDYTGWKSLCHDSFYEDLSAKRLVYCSPADEKLGSSLLRLLKFYGKGFTAPNESVAQIVARVVKSPNEPVETVAANVNEALRNVYGVVSSGGLDLVGSAAASAAFDAQVMGSSNQTMTGMPVSDNRPVERRTPTPRAGGFVWAAETPVTGEPPRSVENAVIEASNALEQRTGMSSMLNMTPAQRRVYFTPESGSWNGVFVNPSTRPSGADIPAQRTVRVTNEVATETYAALRQQIVAITPNGETQQIQQPPAEQSTIHDDHGTDDSPPF